jgi:hypothetical protein
VDSKGSVAQCGCSVTSYPKYFFGNILREPGLTRVLKTSSARRDFVERLPQREARFSTHWLLAPFQSARSTERAKNMAATNGFDQARINKENDRHNSIRGIGGIGLN